MEYKTFTHPEFGDLRAIMLGDEVFFCLADALQALKVDVFRNVLKLCHINFMPQEEIENRLNLSGVAYLPVTNDDKTDLMLFVDLSNLMEVCDMFEEEDPRNDHTSRT